MARNRKRESQKWGPWSGRIILYVYIYSAVPIGLEKVSFHSNPKEMQCQECSNYCTIALISHSSKVMLKILQARLQQYVSHEIPDVQAGFRKGRGSRDQYANICLLIEKAREFQKNIYFCFIDYAKSFECVDHNKLWKILQEMGIPDHLTCFLRNLCAGQEATVRTGHETTDWFQIGKGVHQGCILSPCLFNLYAEYITRNAQLEEAQAGVKIAGRNINNLRYADDIIDFSPRNLDFSLCFIQPGISHDVLCIYVKLAG